MSRYDGHAEWYQAQISGPIRDLTSTSTDVLVRLLGPGPGRCLDLACGTGAVIPDLIRVGWAVTGIDSSEDQLRLARDRLGDGAELVQGDAMSLPCDDATYDAVATRFVHTDVDDFGAVMG